MVYKVYQLKKQGVESYGNNSEIMEKRNDDTLWNI